MREKSSRVISTLPALAIASICKTALVEPPRAITTVMAFSKALRVMMSRGLIFCLRSSSTAAPARSQSRCLSSDIATWEELLGKLIPNASIAEAMVLAVYMPPQEPAPGMALASIAASSASSILLLALAPTASNTETTSSFLSLWQPGRMVPP